MFIVLNFLKYFGNFSKTSFVVLYTEMFKKVFKICNVIPGNMDCTDDNKVVFHLAYSWESKWFHRKIKTIPGNSEELSICKI